MMKLTKVKIKENRGTMTNENRKNVMKKNPEIVMNENREIGMNGDLKTAIKESKERV